MQERSDSAEKVHSDLGSVDWLATGLCFLFPAVSTAHVPMHEQLVTNASYQLQCEGRYFRE